MRRRVIVGLLPWLLAACLPTIDIGSNLADSSGADAADAGNDGGMTMDAADDGQQTTSSGSGSGDGDDSTTISEADTTQGGLDDDPTSSTDSGGSSSSESGQGFSCSDVFPIDIPCLSCAEDECCDEIELCNGQPECADCFLACIQGGAPPDLCQTGCAPASGTAAIVTCLSLACTVSC